MVHILNIMRREQQRFAAGEGGAHQLDEVPPCKGVLAQKRLVHQVVGHPLGKACGQLHPGTLAGGEMPDDVRPVQAEKLQKLRVPRGVKRRVQVGQQLAVGGYRQRGVIAALAGDVTDTLVLFARRSAVQQRRALVGQQARNTAQHRSFTGAILTQYAHDLPTSSVPVW